MRLIVPFLLLTLSLVLALFHEGNYSYVPLIIFCILLGVTAIYQLIYRKVDVHLQLKETAIKQSLIQLKFNKPRLFSLQGSYRIICQHNISQEQQVVTGVFNISNRSKPLSIPIQWSFCGQMTIVQATVSFEDPLRWSKYTKDIQQKEAAILWPTLRFLEHNDLTGSSFTAMGYEAGAHERFVPYMPGDAVHGIHWPLSSRLQTLIVQKPAFATTNSLQYALYFNEITTAEQYDLFMSQCYSVLQQEQMHEISVWTDSWQQFSVQSEDDIATLFRYLLAQPLESLYAANLPSSQFTVFRYKGGNAA